MQEGSPITASKMSQSVGLRLGEVKYSFGGRGQASAASLAQESLEEGQASSPAAPKSMEEAKGGMRASSWSPRDGEEEEE